MPNMNAPKLSLVVLWLAASSNFPVPLGAQTPEWIWHDNKGAAPADGEVRFFRKTFTVDGLASKAVLSVAGDGLRCMRDPTRGGVATVLNEIALTANVGIVVAEERVPVRPEVTGACEILGIDPLYVANEGKVMAVLAPEVAEAALDAVRGLPGCERAALIGEARAEPPGRVLCKTAFGGHRMIDLLVGDPLPRIC